MPCSERGACPALRWKVQGAPSIDCGGSVVGAPHTFSVFPSGHPTCSALLASMLQIRKLRLNMVEWLVHGHVAGEW